MADHTLDEAAVTKIVADHFGVPVEQVDISTWHDDYYHETSIECNVWLKPLPKPKPMPRSTPAWPFWPEEWGTASSLLVVEIPEDG